MPKKRQPKTPQPGSWRVRDHGYIIPSVLRSVLTRGDALNECERDFLIEILKRLEDAKPATRADLGIIASRAHAKVQARNEAAAEEYLQLMQSGKTAAAAATTVMRKYGSGVRDTIENKDGEALPRARARLLVAFLNTPSTQKVTRKNSGKFPV